MWKSVYRIKLSGEKSGMTHAYMLVSRGNYELQNICLGKGRFKIL